MAVKFFNFDDVEIHLLTPVPISIREGLVMNGTYIELGRDSDDVNVYVGIGGEVLVSDNPNPVHILKLEYLPNAKGAIAFGAYARFGLPFGISISAKAPMYKGIASFCRVKKRSKTVMKKMGHDDQKFEIIMTDYIDETGV